MARMTIGVDAGGTGTSAALARDGEIVRTVQGDPGNATLVGVEAAAEASLRTVRDAAGDHKPSAIYIGAAGAGRVAVARELEGRIGAAYPEASLRVADDAEIALRAAACGHGRRERARVVDQWLDFFSLAKWAANS